MNPVACVSKVLERIVENINSFEESQNITAVIDSVCEIGSYALRKSLPCYLLRNVFFILSKFHKHTASLSSVSKFSDNVNQFYRTGNLTSNLKCVLLSYFPPAAEAELLILLNTCTKVCNIDELPALKRTVIESCLPSACAENPEMFHKVNCILKQTFTVTACNPVVGYMSFVFNQAVRNVSKPCSSLHLFPSEFCHLEILFSLPKELFCEQQKMEYVRYLLTSLVNAVEMDLCDDKDLVFLCAVFPSLYHQAMTYFRNETFDAFKFLRIVYNVDSEIKTFVNIILENSIWKCLLEN